MALFEAVANVVTRYKADVSDNIKGLQKLKGEERARAEALLEQHKKTNEALENQIKGYQKVAGGLVLLTAGVAAATKGLDAYAKTSDEARAKVEKLQESGSKAFDTIFASIGQSVVALEPLITGVADLIGLLDKVGIAAPVAIGALGFAISKNPKVAALLAAVGLAIQAKDWLSDSGTAPSPIDDAFARNGQRMRMLPSGMLAIEDIPAEELAAAAQKKAADEQKRKDAVNFTRVTVNSWFDDGSGISKTLSDLNSSLDERIAAVLSRALGVDQWSGPIAFGKGGKGGKAKEGPFRSYVGAISTDYQFGGDGSTTLGVAADQQAIVIDTMAPLQKLIDDEKGRQATVLERMFGPLEEFDAYAESFGMLTGAATSAYDALVEGNMSAGDAMKAFLKDAIKGLGSRMLIRALEETAEGVASLASPLTAAAAPAHFKAAGLFAAGAVTAGVIASQMGGGGSVGGGTSASLPRDMGTGRDQYDGGKSKVIIIGDPMADDSPRYKARNVDRMLNMAVRTSAGRYA